MLIDSVPSPPSMVGEPETLQDFHISSKEPDTAPVVVGMFIVAGFSFFSLFVGGIVLLSVFLEGFSLIVVFGAPFFAIPFFLIRSFLRKFSTLRLRVEHSQDSIVVERAFQGKVWKRIRRSVSEAKVLSYHYYIIVRTDHDKKAIHGKSAFRSKGPVIGHTTATNSSGTTYHKYHIHGSNTSGADWKIEISKVMEGDDHDKAKKIALYTGVEFRNDGQIVPKGLVIG